MERNKAQTRFLWTAHTSQPKYNSQQAPGIRAGLRGSNETRPQPARFPAYLCEHRRRRSARRDLWSKQRARGGAEHGGGRGLGAAQAPPPSLPAGLRAPERLFSVCARGRRVWFGLPFPLTPGLAAPAFFVATPSLLSCSSLLLSLLPSSFPLLPPPPRTAGRGTSSGQQPGEAARRGLTGPARAPRLRGGEQRVGPRPRRARARASFPGPPPPSAGPSRRRRVLPRPPRRGAPRPGPRALPAPPPLVGARNRCHAAFPYSSSRAGMPKLFPGRGRRVPASSP